MLPLDVLEVRDHFHNVCRQVLEINLFQFGSSILKVLIENSQLISELVTEVVENFGMPAIILSLDVVQHQMVIDDDWTEILFSLTVVEGTTVFTDLGEQLLPEVDIFAQPFINLFGIDLPQGFVV